MWSVVSARGIAIFPLQQAEQKAVLDPRVAETLVAFPAAWLVAHDQIDMGMVVRRYLVEQVFNGRLFVNDDFAGLVVIV